MYKRLVETVIVVVVIILGGIAAFNYMVDPSNIFSNDTVKSAVEIMLKEKNVKGLSNWDEVSLKREFIKKSTNTPNIVVLGSSRSMGINQELFPDDVMHNYSVSGGGLEKIISLWYSSDMKNPEVEKYIIEIDDWAFVDNKSSSITQDDITAKAIAYVNDTQDDSITIRLYFNDIKKYSGLLSWQYFEKSREVYKAKVEVNPTEKWIDDVPVLHFDGSYHHGNIMNNPSDEKLVAAVQKHINSSLRNYLGNHQQISEAKRLLFEKWIRKIRNNGQDVVIFLSPYNPEVYNHIEQNDKFKVVLDTENYLRDFCRMEGIPVIGSYDPCKLGLTSKDFFDGMHLKEAVVEEYWQSQTQTVL